MIPQYYMHSVKIIDRTLFLLCWQSFNLFLTGNILMKTLCMQYQILMKTLCMQYRRETILERNVSSLLLEAIMNMKRMVIVTCLENMFSSDLCSLDFNKITLPFSDDQLVVYPSHDCPLTLKSENSSIEILKMIGRIKYVDYKGNKIFLSEGIDNNSLLGP